MKTLENMMNEVMTKQTRDDLGTGVKDGYALYDLARGWLKQGNPVVAIELLKPAIHSAEAERDMVLWAGLLKEIGRVHMMQANWEAADSYFLEAQRVFLSKDHLQGASECARNRANLHFQKGNYRVADELCQQALEWATEISNYELRATILNTVGAIKSATGNTKESINVLKLCLADFRSSGNSIRQGYVLLNIGLAQTETGDYREAIESLNQALALALDEKDLSLVEMCYQNISKCYLARKETVLAKAVLDTARRILPGLSSKGLECELNLLDGRTRRIMGNLDGAESVLKEAYEMAVEYDLAALIGDILFEQGLIARDAGNMRHAITMLDAAANQYNLVGVERGFKNVIAVLEQIRKKTNV